MKIEMDIALQELIENGTSKEYRSVANNKVLYNGLIRAYQVFEEKEDRITLRLIKIDDTHYGNKK